MTKSGFCLKAKQDPFRHHFRPRHDRAIGSGDYRTQTATRGRSASRRNFAAAFRLNRLSASPAFERSMDLIQEFVYRVKTTGPLKTTAGSPYGERTYWTVSDAEIEGSRIKARIAAQGSDWMRVSNDGSWRPDVRVPFQTDDGETILMHYTGLVQQTSAFKRAAEANQSTAYDDQYMRLMIHFDTGAKAYSWLNTSLFVAKGRLLGTGSIEYLVYRLT